MGRRKRCKVCSKYVEANDTYFEYELQDNQAVAILLKHHWCQSTIERIVV